MQFCKFSHLHTQSRTKWCQKISQLIVFRNLLSICVFPVIRQFVTTRVPDNKVSWCRRSDSLDKRSWQKLTTLWKDTLSGVISAAAAVFVADWLGGHYAKMITHPNSEARFAELHKQPREASHRVSLQGNLFSLCLRWRDLIQPVWGAINDIILDGGGVGGWLALITFDTPPTPAHTHALLSFKKAATVYKWGGRGRILYSNMTKRTETCT